MQVHSATPRHPSTQSSSSHRLPRRTASSVSLHRDREKPLSTTTEPTSSSPFTTLNHARPSYFDAYPQSKRSPSSRTLPSRPSTSSLNDGNSETRRGIHTKGFTEPVYTFPTIDSVDHSGASGDEDLFRTPKSSRRNRSRTISSRKQVDTWEDSMPRTMRFSETSTIHSEETPDTPPDSRFLADFPVMVNVPINGVETMDALVADMNGGEDVIGSTMARARFGIPNHHPLYQPPLPTPPPGVVLGGGKARRPKKKPSTPRPANSSGDEDDSPAPSTRRKRHGRPSASRVGSTSTIISVSTPSAPPVVSRPPLSPKIEHRKSSAPSIEEIIRAHDSPTSIRTRPSTNRPPSRTFSNHSHISHAPSSFHEEAEVEPETIDEESDYATRSSIDSIAHEVQQTLKTHNEKRPKIATTLPPPSFAISSNRYSFVSDSASVRSPRSDGGGAASVYSSSAGSSHIPLSPFDPGFTSHTQKPGSSSQAVAQYLRSTRITTLLKLTRSPHASSDNPLTVSLSDLGSPTGHPVVVFLGLGCVRHIMGLYDEMADCLGLRLITIDRWGLGRTEARAKSAKGIMQWATVVEEVLDLLHIDKCSVMAHSAGAPYALSFANKLPARILGNVCLLAPWVGGNESGGGYKWLKYVPNGLLKTAQAADWKMQAWMIGKPPTITYEGIGYTHAPSQSQNHSSQSLGGVYTSTSLDAPRPSIASSNFSEYDDLRDFEGRFESKSTLGATQGRALPAPPAQPHRDTHATPTRKTSRSFLGRLRGVSSSTPQSPVEEPKPPIRRLKALRSMGSLKSKSNKKSNSDTPPNPSFLPTPPKVNIGLGLDDLDWERSLTEGDTTPVMEFNENAEHVSFTSSSMYPRAQGKRSISLSSPSLPLSPTPSTYNSSFIGSTTTKDSSDLTYQAAVGNALIAASHAESSRGTHNDLLQILNHDNHPWGFSYASYPHRVKVWYGDRDEKIAENAVRWMEKNMGPDRCAVTVIRGADHGLMYKSSVVVEVLETISSYWHGAEH